MRTLRPLLLSSCLMLILVTLSSFKTIHSGSDFNPAVPEGLPDAEAKFCVFLGAYEDMIPIGEAVPIGSIKGASCVKSDKGIYEFYSPLYETEEEADAALASFQEMGLTSLKKLVYYQESYYTQSEFTALKANQKSGTIVYD